MKRKLLAAIALFVGAIISSGINVKANNSEYYYYDYYYEDEDGNYYEEPLEKEVEVIMPKLKSLNVSPSKAKGFTPGGANAIYINIPIICQGIDISVKLEIYNSKNKLVYSKSLKQSRTYVNTVRWNGKVFSKNEAGLKNGAYVPKGTYKAIAKASFINSEGKRETIEKSIELKVNSPGTSIKYGNTPKNAIPIYTGDAYIDYMARDITGKIIKDGMSSEEKFKAIYDWIIKNCIHNDGQISREQYVAKYDWDKLESKALKYQEDLNDMVQKGKANLGNHSYWELYFGRELLQYRIGVCDNMAAALKILCNHVGMECELVSGLYLNQNGTKAGHAWNYVLINNKYYWADVDVELKNWHRQGKGKIPYYWYLKDGKEWKTNHEWNHDGVPEGLK